MLAIDLSDQGSVKCNQLEGDHSTVIVILPNAVEMQRKTGCHGEPPVFLIYIQQFYLVLTDIICSLKVDGP
jgi:hypothetical protein